MNVGTLSVLVGAHQFVLHPVLVALAWWRLYGFPRDPRLWIAFVVHDLGYVGKPNMDGAEGETHVDFGARVMGLFGKGWADFCRDHSRYAAKRAGRQPSRLCIADKFVIVIEPWWLYLPRVALTGELKEYMSRSATRVANNDHVSPAERAEILSGSAVRWHRGVQAYLGRWVEAHRGGARDTWTLSAIAGQGRTL
jgi:hypothetical protein